MGSVRDELLKKYANKEEEDEKKSSSSKETTSKPKDDSSSVRTTMLSKYAGSGEKENVSSDSISKFLLDAEDYLSNANYRYTNLGFSTATDAWNKNRTEANNLLAQGYSIRDYLLKNKSSVDERTYESLTKQLDTINEAVRSYTSAFRDANKFYSQWETEEDYLTWKKETEAYEALKNFDTKKGEAEVQDLEKVLNEYKALSRTMINERMQERLDYITANYGDEKGIKALIAEKKQYINQAKHIQEGITLAGVINNDDFKAKSGYVSTKNDGAWSKLTSQYGLGYDDLTYEYINGAENGVRDEIKQQYQYYSHGSGDSESIYESNNYDYMTEDQIATYNYYYAKDGKKAAEKYLKSIQETLNYQAATERYEKLEGKTALELLFGVEAGLDQFKSGMKNLFNTEDNYIAQSSTQMVSGMVREDLADDGAKLPDWMGGASLGQMGYDAITTSANMAPSILTSVVVSMLNPVAGQWVGSAMMGASASGNAYQQALNEGYDKDQARGYSILVGGSEMIMEKLLGGISALGGNSLGKFFTRNISNADTALKMIAKKLGGSILSEFSEEYLQEVLTPVFQNIAFGTDNEVKLFTPEALYSGILGAITAGIMEGPSAVGTEVRTHNIGKGLQAADISAARLAEIGKTFSADTVAYQLAGKVDENTGAYTLGRLFNEIGASLSEQNVTEITEALVAKGMDQTTAMKNAKALAYVVEGGQLSEGQIAMIESNDVLAEVARTTLIDSNTTWNQRTKGYNDALMALANEKASRTNPAKQTQEKAPVADTVDTQNTEAVQSLSEADAVDTSPAKVQTISSIANGQVTVKLEDGTEINVKDADLSVDDGVRIETIAKLDGISATDANFILNTLRTNTSTTAQMDSLGAREAYKYGFYGFSQDHMTTHGVFANSLTETQRKAIYETGRAARQRQVEAKQATVAKNATTTNEVSNKGKVHFEGDRSTLTERQSVSLTAMEKVADALGVQIYVFESDVNERGQRVGANGWYDPKDSSIHIDLHAGNNGEGTMLFTAAHELTHHIRKWSPAKFKVLADFLVQEYGKKGVNVDSLVREQMAKAERNGRTISYDTAYEEVVADSMETMLSDGNVIKRLEKLKAQDKDLWHKIKSYIDELAAKIRTVYNRLAPGSVEGRYVAEMGKAVYRLQELFAEGLVDASENYQASLTPGEEGVVVNENGDPVAYSTEDGSVLLSMRTYEEEGRAEFRKYLQKCVSSNQLTQAEMQEMMDGIEDIYQTCKEFKDKYAPFSSWSDAAVVRDTYGKPVFSVVTPNGDYKMNLDFSLVCKKRRTLDAVFNEMSRRGIIDDFELGQKSVVKINEIIRKYGLETACALCFVDAKRFRQASMADQFTNLYNELVLSLVPEDQRTSIDHFNFSGYETIKKVEDGIHKWDASKLDFSHLNEVMKKYGKGTVEHKAAKYIKSHAEGRRLLLRGDFMSSKGFDAVKTQNKDILKLYNSKKGTGGPKAAFGDVQYMNEIIKKAKTWTPEKAYAVGGVRIQSFSDYVPRMVFDYVQMVYDLAATNLPAHAYTKEALFVKQFGLTGIKINMSLIPAIAEGVVAPGLDANGNYVWAGESFDFETAKQIQNAEGYTENCGTICVGVSDRHIRKLLSDPDIRMVIPYHKSGLNPIVAHMNKIAEFSDYTNKQNTTVKATGAKAEKHFDFNKALHDMGENADPKAVIQQYFDWCDDNGYDPKFADFRDHPNYYKLIEDFTLYDKDGKYVPQREVRAAFPKEGSAFGSMKDLIKAGLEEDAIIEGKKESSLSSIVDEIQNTLPRTEAEIAEEQVEQADRDLEELKLSDRDYSYDSLVSKPDMAVATVDENVPKNRADIIALAKKNATSVGRFDPKTGSISVHVKDIGKDVVLGTTGLKHGLDGRRTDNAIVTTKAGEILQNSIRINELTPKKEEADGSYVLIGAARGNNGDLYIVRSVVNTFKNELMSMDVLYAINTKKGNRLRSMRPGFQGPVTDSTISIAELLDHVNQYFPDVLPEEVLKHYGYDARPEGSLGEDALYSDRDSDGNQLSEDQQEFFAESKVRDSGGNLMVMYHGTANGGAFTVFDGDKLGNESRTTQIGQGFYFTNMKKEAEAYTKNVDIYGRVSNGKNPHLHQVYLNITNPFNIDTDVLNVEKVKAVYMDGTYDYFFDSYIPFYLNKKTVNGRTLTKPELQAMSKAERVSAYVDYLASFGSSDYAKAKEVLSNMVRAFPNGKQSELLAAMKNILGYDGIVEEFKPGQYQYVAFSPEQVKAIDNQNPTSDPDIRYSDRDVDSVSNRSLLANAFEGVAQNDIERQKIQEYRGKIDLINAEERKLADLNQKIKDLSFAKGPKDTKAIRDLQFQAKQTANRISTYDKQLLALEASKPLQNVLTREKKMAYQRAEKKGKEALEAYREKTMKTQRELLEKWQDSRKKGIEGRQRTAMRHKIKDVVNELNQYLLKGTKDRHVPESLQKAVAEALDAVNMDTVGAEERIAKLQAELMKAKTPEEIQAISRKIDHIREMGDKMSNRLKKLKDAYDDLLKSPDMNTVSSYDEVIHNKLESVIDKIGDTPLRDMNLAQLEDVYDMYKMVLKAIRDVNKSFKDAKKQSISTRANAVMAQVEEVGGKHKLSLKMLNGIKKFGWNNLKPVYAFEHIGSITLTEAFKNVRAGEDVWALDITEAREFYLDKYKKYKYDSWDLQKQYNFQSTTGMDFSLNLEQILSLYAYSKRDQAADHLKYGGIVFDESTKIVKKTKMGISLEFNPTDATAYNISDETLASIISKLTDEQKAFADEMQDYLSTVMGAKGNEVTMAMYDIKLFKDKHYFPLKSAQQFMEKAREQQKGEVKIKNSGFSKETVPNAKNPIVLTPFMEVWSNHVNEMSMYHAFVLPLEDFYRIYNYKTPSNNETLATEGVNQYIQNAYGRGATAYIDQLLKDLNGGARTDNTTGFINKMMGMFKKGAVFASMSVVVQQPSAIARALALVDTKYFIGPKVDHKRHKALWDEVKQYAPVAIIKEMGYFDTNMGKSTQDFILGKEYSGFKDKMKALFTDSAFRDEALSKAPALADEIAWCGIWEAVKRETKAKNPGMDGKSEDFLKMCGERFTEVIVKTQVYDSVLSRSGLMRSKDTGMKMATAFMAEPTTSINMIADALLQGKRGHKKYARAAIGAVIASQILNSILVSFVYAGRDDDEDETYLEKYIGTLSGQTLDSLNPLSYIPFIKDIISIVKGYDVERSDMAVISDLWKAWENLKKDYISPYRKVEDFAGSMAQIFGLPVKNIMRDARGIYQTVDSFVNGSNTTKAGIGYALKSAMPKWAGGGDVSNDQQLYEAILSGDQTQIDRVKGRYADEKAVNTAMRSAIKEHFLAGDLDSETAIKYLEDFCGDDADEAFWKVEEWQYKGAADEAFSKYNELYGAVQTGKDLKAIIKKYTDNGVTQATLKSQISDHFKEQYIEMSTSERAGLKGYLLNAMTLLGDDREDAEKKISAWEFEAANGFSYENRRELYLNGEITGAQVRDAVMTYGGKTAEEADEYVESLLFEAEYGFAYSDRADAYKSGKISSEELKHILMTAGGKTSEEADLQIQAYDWEAEGYDNVTSAAVRDYAEYCAAVNVPKDVYLHIRTFSNNTDNDVDANGKTIYYSAMKKIMAEINAQYGLTNAQKDALARSMGWAEKNILKYKLW